VTTLACYISGHGLGHAARTIEVLRALRARRPDLRFVVRTPLEREFFDFNLGGEFSHGAARLDVGAVQSDSLSVDMEASLRSYAEIHGRSEALIESEVGAVAPHRPSLLLADIPALAFDIAERLGIPGIGMTNFSWDWIYADYACDFPAYRPLVDDLRTSYGRATLLLRLPLHGDLSAFPRCRDIPLIARVASLDRSTVRQRLDLPLEERIVLFSFGGLGLRLTRGVPKMRGVRFVTVQSAAVASSSVPGASVVTDRQMEAAGIRYEDLVGASDAVMTKPGYGIVAECIANGTPMVYTERGRFAEYDCLVEGIRAHLAHAFIDNDDLRAGRWQVALEQVFSQPHRMPSADVSGAGCAADSLLAILAGESRKGRQLKTDS
jgi:L-arabinokinase